MGLNRFIKTIFCILALWAPTTAIASEYLFAGTGAPRIDRRTCLNDLSKFEANLKSNTLLPIENVLCVETEDGTNHYLPKFKAKSEITSVLETTLGARFSSQSYCEVERERIVSALPKNNFLIDSACQEIEKSYQPFIVTLKPAHGPDDMVVYNGFDVLVQATDVIRIRSMYPNN